MGLIMRDNVSTATVSKNPKGTIGFDDFKVVLEPSWGRLEASWAVLGSSWDRLGAVLGGLGVVLGHLGRKHRCKRGFIMRDNGSRAKVSKNL